MAKNNAFFKKLNKLKLKPKEIQDGFQKLIGQIAPNILKGIEKSITRGGSPVEGKGRYQDYSDSYKQAIGGRFKNAAGDVITSASKRYSQYNKKVRPVNLRLTGDMLKSLAYKVMGSALTIFFNSRLAVIHDEKGAGKRKVIRRLLPRKTGERLTRTVFDKFDRQIKKELLRMFRK
jgi:hypothetical protein